MVKSIVLNNKIIEYDLKYNSKKNVNIHIKPDLTLNVSAPRWVVKGELERILYNKSSWILDNLEKQRRIQKTKKINILENGHSIWFRGEKYRLYYKMSDRNYVYIFEDQILIFTKKLDDLEYSQKIFLKWLKSTAEQEFMAILDRYWTRMSKKYNIPHYTLQVRSMKSRWGTCIPSKKKITMNLSLMFAPTEYAEYIALHELTHFIEIYHNNHFYSIVEEFMTDYKERQKALNEDYSQVGKYI